MTLDVGTVIHKSTWKPARGVECIFHSPCPYTILYAGEDLGHWDLWVWFWLDKEDTWELGGKL